MSTCVTYYGLFYCTIGFVLRHCWRLIAPLDWYCASVSQYYLSFKLSGKVVFFHLFCHLSFYFFAPAAFILELHRCSKGRSISRVQTENCYNFRHGFCFSLWVNCRVGYCHCHLKCVLRSISRVQTENCTIDKQSPYVKLLLFSKRVLLVIVRENCRVGYCLEWNCRVGYCHACCTFGVVLRSCFWILFEFQVITKGCIITRPRIANRRWLGTSQPMELYCTTGDYFSRYDLSFKWSGKVVKDLAMIRDLMRRVNVTVTEIQTWNVAKLFQENVVWLEM